MIDVAGIARCARCNVISLPLFPEDGDDPCVRTVRLPEGWSMGVLRFHDGVQRDWSTLCPDCTTDAVEWLNRRVVRQPSNAGQCLHPVGWGEEKDFCCLPSGHPLPHEAPCPRCGGKWGEDTTCGTCTDETGEPRPRRRR